MGALRFGIVVIVFKWRSCRRQLLTCPLDAARGQPYFRIGRWASFARICAGYFKQCNHTYFARWLHLGQTRASVEKTTIRDRLRDRRGFPECFSRKHRRTVRNIFATKKKKKMKQLRYFHPLARYSSFSRLPFFNSHYDRRGTNDIGQGMFRY